MAASFPSFNMMSDHSGAGTYFSLFFNNINQSITWIYLNLSEEVSFNEHSIATIGGQKVTLSQCNETKNTFSPFPGKLDGWPEKRN